MPSQPTWFHRLDDILDTLRAMDASHLDRAAVERLFRVRERRARQIMAGLPGLKAGNAVAVERAALLARMEETAASGVYQWEVTRRARVAEELDRTRRQLAGRQVKITVPADTGRKGMAGLGPDIALQPGALRIAFSGAEDLATKLLALSQVMAEDWRAFARAVE